MMCIPYPRYHGELVVIMLRVEREMIGVGSEINDPFARPGSAARYVGDHLRVRDAREADHELRVLAPGGKIARHLLICEPSPKELSADWSSVVGLVQDGPILDADLHRTAGAVSGNSVHLEPLYSQGTVRIIGTVPAEGVLVRHDAT